MATLVELVESGVLDTIDPLEVDELPWRTLYATRDFIVWLDEVLPGLENNPLYGDLSPLDQVYSVFVEYVAGDVLLNDRRFKKLNRTPDLYVWEFKTDDVRIFGWVPERDKFICCFGDSKSQIVAHDSYGKYMAQTSFVRRNMELDEPKCLETERLDDVVSTKN